MGDTLILVGTVAESWQCELANEVVLRFHARRVRNEILVGSGKPVVEVVDDERKSETVRL